MVISENQKKISIETVRKFWEEKNKISQIVVKFRAVHSPPPQNMNTLMVAMFVKVIHVKLRLLMKII